jgi:hypothetical protein
MSAYRPNGDSPLTPDELKLIRNKLMAGNTLWEFELYVIILLCCRMFLREDEIGKMAYSTVNSDITVVKSNDCVEGIAMQVQGKADSNPVTLMMWFDHEFPEFCPVRHLLAWLRLSQIQDGYFFPSYNFLNTTIINDASWNGCCVEPISYSDVLSAWKNLCGTILERVGRFGSHSGRKTGYLFGVWGGAQDTDLMLSARHKTVKNAMIYKRDAAFLLALAQENMNSLTLRTPKWRSIYCEQHQLAMVVNNNSRPHFKHIYQLATIFVEKKLGILQQTLQKCSRAIADKLMKYSHQYGCLDDSRNELQELLKSLDATIGGRIASLHCRILEELQQNMMTGNTEDKDKTNDSGNTQQHQNEKTVTPDNQKRVGSWEKWDHPYRKEIKNLNNNSEKIQKIMEIHDAATKEKITPSKMTEPCRAFFKDSAAPIIGCLTLHFNGNVKNFLEHHTRSGKFGFSKFFKICPGKEGISCCNSNIS